MKVGAKPFITQQLKVNHDSKPEKVFSELPKDESQGAINEYLSRVKFMLGSYYGKTVIFNRVDPTISFQDKVNRAMEFYKGSPLSASIEEVDKMEALVISVDPNHPIFKRASQLIAATKEWLDEKGVTTSIILDDRGYPKLQVETENSEISLDDLIFLLIKGGVIEIVEKDKLERLHPITIDDKHNYVGDIEGFLQEDHHSYSPDVQTLEYFEGIHPNEQIAFAGDPRSFMEWRSQLE